MLHTLFFVLSFLTDPGFVAEAVRNGSYLAFVNAGIFCLIGVWLAFRQRRAIRNGPASSILPVRERRSRELRTAHSSNNRFE